MTRRLAPVITGAGRIQGKGLQCGQGQTLLQSSMAVCCAQLKENQPESRLYGNKNDNSKKCIGFALQRETIEFYLLWKA